MKNYESLPDALRDLNARGYIEFFEMKTDHIYCGLLDLRLNPDKFDVDEIYRFVDPYNPDESSTLYVISSSLSINGTLVDAFGVYAEDVSFEMARKLRISEDF